MKVLLLCVLTAISTAPASAAKDDGTQVVTGQVGVGTLAPRARLGVVASYRDKAALSVSDAAGKAALFVDLDGRTGIGSRSPLARLDITGYSDFGLVNLPGYVPGGRSPSLTFSAADGIPRFEIRAYGDASGSVGDSLGISYSPKSSAHWSSSESLPIALAIGGGVLSRACTVQARPGGPAVYELEVSAGGSRAGYGIIRYGESGEHGSRSNDIILSRLGTKEELQAYNEISRMKLSQYDLESAVPRSRHAPAVLRGIRYKDAPESIKAPNQSIVLDERIMNLELALKEADRRIRELNALVEAAESQ